MASTEALGQVTVEDKVRSGMRLGKEAPGLEKNNLGLKISLNL